jgi:hypothetical protein
MHDKPPIVNGLKPNIKQDCERISEINSRDPLNPKIADEYDHYPSCDWAIVEYKSRSIKDAVEQLVDTAAKLAKSKKPLDHAYIVSKGMSGSEKKIFTRRNTTLYTKHNRSPVRIKHETKLVDVDLYYQDEVEKQYSKYDESIAKWVYK